MLGDNKRRAFHLLVLAILTVGTLVIGPFLTSSLTDQQSWWSRGAWIVAGIIVYFLYLRWQARSREESPEAIKERVSQLEPELRKQVQARSYGTRRNLIEAPLRELELDITPRMGWVRDPRLLEPEPLSEKSAHDIVGAFESSKRRLFIVGEPGSGKTIAAYSLIEYLDNTEGDERIPFLVNLSAWEAQDTFETFFVDYLCSSVGYEVRERAIASAFIGSGQYSLILDGLDEIPVRLRAHFSERLDEFVRGLPGEVGVVVTCRIQEYEEILASYRTGLGLVQAVEILPLISEQVDSALVELAKVDEDWGAFLSQRHLTARQRARNVLSNPLFLNLAVAGRLPPRALLECDEEQEIRDLVLDSYLHRTLADQRHYEPEDASRYLAWIARFLDGDEVSPFGLKATDYTVFDLADLTPPDPPRLYRLFGGLVIGLIFGLVFWVLVAQRWVRAPAGPVFSGKDFSVLICGLIFALGLGLVFGLPTKWPFRRSAVSSRLILVWPSTRRQLIDLIRRAGRGLIWGLKFGLGLGMVLALVFGLWFLLPEELGGLGVADATFEVAADKGWEPGGVLGALLVFWLIGALGFVLVMALSFGLVMALGFGLLEPRSVLITSRTPKEARSRSLTAALTWLLSGLVPFVLIWVLAPAGPIFTVLVTGLVWGLGLGLLLALRNGGWFVVLQKVAHRRLARAGALPSRPYDFLEWGIERQIFRRVGGGVRFRHNLVQQRLASTSEGVSQV